LKEQTANTESCRGPGNQITDGWDFFLSQGREGVIIVKTNQAILVAHYPESVQPGPAANTVEQLADYLVGVGY
jgi:profilin